MFVTTAFAMCIVTRGPDSVAGELAMLSAGKSLYACPVGVRTNLGLAISGKKDLERKLDISGYFRCGAGSGLAWNSSSLLPAFYPTQQDISRERSLMFLGKLVERGKTQGVDVFPEFRPGSGANPGIPLSDFSHQYQNYYESKFHGLKYLGGSDTPRASIGAELELIFSSKSGKERDYVMGPPRTSASPLVAEQIYSNLEAMMKRIERAREHRERIPRPLEAVLSKHSAGLGPGTYCLPLQSIVNRLQPDRTPVLFVDSRVARSYVYLKIGKDQTSAASLAEVVARGMGMYWRRVGDIYFLACSPGDPLVAARQYWLCTHSKGLFTMLDGLSGSSALGGLWYSTFLDQPEKMSDADLGVLSSLMTVLVADQKEASQFRDSLQNPDFLAGKFQIDLTITQRISAPPYLGEVDVPLGDENIASPASNIAQASSTGSTQGH